MTRRGWRSWTQAEDEALELLRLRGLTYAAIGGEIGRSEFAVKSRCTVLGAVRGFPRRAEYLAAVCGPHSNTAVACRLGVSLSAVVAMKTALRKAGHKVPRSRCA